MKYPIGIEWGYAYPLQWLCRVLRGHRFVRGEENLYPFNKGWFIYRCRCGYTKWERS